MWESLLLDLFRTYLPAMLFALTCVISFLLFRNTKEKGYLAISSGFIILTVGWVVSGTVTRYLWALLDVSLSYWYLISLYVFYAVIYLVPALLILIGFFYIYKQSKQKKLQTS
jgi:hypothetical protein